MSERHPLPRVMLSPALAPIFCPLVSGTDHWAAACWGRTAAAGPRCQRCAGTWPWRGGRRGTGCPGWCWRSRWALWSSSWGSPGCPPRSTCTKHTRSRDRWGNMPCVCVCFFKTATACAPAEKTVKSTTSSWTWRHAGAAKSSRFSGLSHDAALLLPPQVVFYLSCCNSPDFSLCCVMSTHTSIQKRFLFTFFKMI